MTAGTAERAAPRGRALALAGGLLAFGAAPFVAARTLFAVDGAGIVHGPGPGPCPLLASTGIPCPACGATRAFVHAVHGDAATFSYNYLWLLPAIALIALGAWLLVRVVRAHPRPVPRWLGDISSTIERRPLLTPLPFLGFTAAAWLVAFVNVDAIRAG